MLIVGSSESTKGVEGGKKMSRYLPAQRWPGKGPGLQDEDRGSSPWPEFVPPRPSCIPASKLAWHAVGAW